jgi:hypothetical protein
VKKLSIFEITILVVCGVSFFEAIILNSIDFDLSIFNPIRNYNKLSELNWFGVSVITIWLNIIFIPYAICYWIYKTVAVICQLIRWLFTVGRK